MRFDKKLMLAVGMLKNAKLRSWLTVIGIVIAVSSVTMILSFGEGIKTEVNNKVGGSGAKTITLSEGWSENGNSLITINDFYELEKMPEISGLLRITNVYTKVYFEGEEKYQDIKGFDLDKFEGFYSSYKLVEGEYLQSGDTERVMVSKDFLNQSFEEDYRPELYDYLEIAGEQYQIVGIFESGGMFEFSRDSIIASLEDVWEINQWIEGQKSEGENGEKSLSELNLPPGVTEEDVYEKINIKVDPSFDFDKAKKSIEENLMSFRNSDEEEPNFYLFSKDLMLSELNQVVNVVTWVLVGFASISVIVGSVGIANTMFTSVLEKTKEIGIMKAIGAKNVDISHIFLLNAGALGLVGGIIGVVIGLFFALIGGFAVIHFAKLEDISLLSLLSFKVIFGALLFSILIGMASGFFPAKSASKQDPVVALRSE